MSLKRSIETLIEKIEPVITENDEFEYRDKSILIIFFGTSGYQDSDARIKVIDFRIESSSESLKLSMETFMWEIDPVVTESEHEFRDKAKIALFRILGLSEFGCKKQNRLLWDGMVCHNLEGFDWDFFWWNQIKPVVIGR